jgi:hypothetical protein
MINTDLYIQYIRQEIEYNRQENDPISYIKVDLFKDENIELNSSIQNVSDISKTFSDFSQSFTIPASDKNNGVFQHYYNTDVDGNFNPNIRIRGYIECGSLPFRYGVIQLEDVKLKNMQPDSYTIRFFSASVNLSDRFGDDDLTSLDLSEFDHQYNADIFDATYSNSLGEDLYYPLVTSTRPYQIGTGDSNDIANNSGKILYTDLRPALKLIRIIEAIETKYEFTFDRDFLGRAVFGNLHMWVFGNLDLVPNTSDAITSQLTNQGTLNDADTVLDFTLDTINISPNTIPNIRTRSFSIRITPESSFENVIYSMFVIDEFDNIILESQNIFGINGMSNYISLTESKTYRVKISANQSFQYVLRIEMKLLPTSGFFINKFATQPVQAIDIPISISLNLPKIKIRDFITSLIKMFNLALVPVNANSFKLLPLNDWYAQGNLVNLTKYIDSKDVTFKRPKLFKNILFQHQKSGQFLNEQFRNNQGGVLGYGDLQGIYQIDGSELKVQTEVENLMFSRLSNIATGDITNVQVGLSLDKNNKPYIGKPYIFYKCGFQNYTIPIKANGHSDLTKTYLTSTENDFILSQVRNSVNFSTDNSTFLYSEITRNLYSNFWSDYISDLYSTKRRLSNWKANLPIGIIIRLNLNDRIVIDDKAYIINSMKTNLNTGDVDLELLNYIGLPFTSVNSNIPLTADTVDYSADTTLLSADMTYIYLADISPTPNGVEYTNISVSYARQDFDCKINANSPYNVTKIDTGDGTNWVNLERASGQTTDYLLIKVNESTTDRSMDLSVGIGASNFTITINQQQL